MAEIRALRGQLEQSIQVNNCLRLQLEQQLDGGRSKTSLNPSSTSQEDPGDKQGRKDKGTYSEQGSREDVTGQRDRLTSSTLLGVRVKWELWEKAWDLGSQLAPDSEFATTGCLPWARCLKPSGT